MAGPIYFEPVFGRGLQSVSSKNPLPVDLTDSTATSLFGEVTTVQRTPIIELNGAYGTTALRDVETVTNSGTVTGPTEGCIVLSTGTTASSSAQIESAEAGRYQPGYAAEIGLAQSLDADPTGNQVAEWGGLTIDGNDGYLFGMDATGLYVEVRKDGTSTVKVYQSDWNLDTLDGNGPSGLTLDTQDLTIYEIRFSYYGGGAVRWAVVLRSNGTQKTIPVHIYAPSGSKSSISSPNLVLHNKVDNGGDTTDLTMNVGGRQYSIVGRYIPKFRFTGQTRTVSTSTSLIPVVSFRTKTAFQDRSVRIAGYTGIIATEDVEIFILLNASLTNASYTTPSLYTAAETAVETDVSATALTGGEVLWSDIAIAGQANRGNLGQVDLDFDVPQTQPITLAIRTLANTGTAKIHLRVKEEW